MLKKRKIQVIEILKIVSGKRFKIFLVKEDIEYDNFIDESVILYIIKNFIIC